MMNKVKHNLETYGTTKRGITLRAQPYRRGNKADIAIHKNNILFSKGHAITDLHNEF